MTEQRAMEEGLSFTGIYSWEKEKVQTRIKEERKERPKARIMLVRSPANKLSRGSSSGGWSAYADEKYSAYNTIESAIKVIDNHNSNMIMIEKEYDEKKQEAENKLELAREKLKKAEEILN